MYEHKCGEIEVAVVTVDASDNVGVALVKATFTDVVNSSGATGTIELAPNGTDLLDENHSYSERNDSAGRRLHLQFTAIAFDAAGNTSENVTTRPNTYLFPATDSFLAASAPGRARTKRFFGKSVQQRAGTALDPRTAATPAAQRKGPEP